MGNADASSTRDARPDDVASFDPKARFSKRVDDYVKYRPDYPPAAFELLRDEAGLRKGCDVADVGSGTGIFAKALLDVGANVWCVEPNAPMRAAAEQWLGAMPGFHSVDGSAEHTTLPDASADLVTAAQAFHWFDKAGAAREFRRIVRPGGSVAVIWNDRRRGGDPFLDGYDALLLRHGTDYQAVIARHTDETEFTALLGVPVRRHVFPHAQTLDLPGLIGRLMSASYVPHPGQPGHDELMAGARDLFDRCQVGGRVRIAYDTVVYLGRV